MDTDIQRLTRIVEGHTGTNGLQGRVTRIERDLYRNAETNDPGIVSEVRGLQDSMDEIKVTLKNLNWLVRVLGIGGLAAILRTFMGP